MASEKAVVATLATSATVTIPWIACVSVVGRGRNRRVDSLVERTGIGIIPKPLVARSVACRTTATAVAACHTARASATPAVAMQAALNHGHRSATAPLAATTDSVVSVSASKIPRSPGRTKRGDAKQDLRPAVLFDESAQVEPAPSAEGDAHVSLRVPPVIDLDIPSRPDGAQQARDLRQQRILGRPGIAPVRLFGPPPASSRLADAESRTAKTEAFQGKRVTRSGSATSGGDIIPRRRP